MGARERGQLVIQYAGEGKQIVALVLQRNGHRADATRIVGLAPAKLGDDEVKQIFSDLKPGTGQRQDVVGEPCRERLDVAGKRMRCCFGLQGERDPDGKVRILACLPVLACSFLRRDFAPLAMPARVLAKASH